MIDAMTAGNRIMIKMSEAAPQFAQTFAITISRYFSPDMICVVLGEVNIAAAFSELHFDHLLIYRIDCGRQKGDGSSSA